MRYSTKYIFLCFSAIVFFACGTEDKYNFTLLAKDGGNMKVGTTISYLGIEVGEVIEINFASINDEDCVVASIQLNKENILNADSYIAWSEYGALEVINPKNSTLLPLGDTLMLMEKNTQIAPKEVNVITPITTQEINSKEQELLSPEDQKKLDSLQTKIDKLNNLIKEVNDQD